MVSCMLLSVLFGFGLTEENSRSCPDVDGTVIYPETDWIICSQPFAYETLEVGLMFSQYGQWMIADDVIFAGPGNITNIQIWAIYPYSTCTDFNIQLRSNSSAGPGTIIDSTSASSVTHTGTGLYKWDYEIYHTEIIPQYGLISPGGGIFWLALQTNSYDPAYWLGPGRTWNAMTYISENNGASWTSSLDVYGEAFEQFFILDGQYLQLQRTSWGSIKNSF